MSTDVELVTLQHLLKDHAVGDLATAIEIDGIWGWDRYGRQKKFTDKDPYVEIALDGLASQCQWETSVERGEYRDSDPYMGYSPADFCSAQWQGDGLPPWSEWGWPAGELPDVGAVLKKPQRPTKGVDIVYSILAAYMEANGINFYENAAVERLREFMETSQYQVPSRDPLRRLIARTIEAAERRGNVSAK